MVVRLVHPWCDRLRARHAASLLFALRLAPFCLTALAICTVCIPSYLQYEPDAPGEHVGLICMALASLGGVIVGHGFWRSIRALIQSSRFQSAPVERLVVGGQIAIVVDSDMPVLAVSGVICPKLVISRSILQSLSATQLAAAVRHEQAHLVERDNLKRLLMMFAPGIGLGRVDKAWARAAERAADDAAAESSMEQRLELAGALVNVARLGLTTTPPLVTAFAADTHELSTRVDRLLNSSPVAERRFPWTLITLAALVLVGVAVAFTGKPVHRALEALIQ
jgi:beta-lactamase regulating signal transducer with metallopeptidase domain